MLKVYSEPNKSLSARFVGVLWAVMVALAFITVMGVQYYVIRKIYKALPEPKTYAQAYRIVDQARKEKLRWRKVLDREIQEAQRKNEMMVLNGQVRHYEQVTYPPNVLTENVEFNETTLMRILNLISNVQLLEY
jgi:hypothetical protein